MIYIANTFSITMIASAQQKVLLTPISQQEARDILSDEFTSAIDRSEDASVVSNHLGVVCPWSRVRVSLRFDDVLIFAQYIGERLPDGTVELPEGASIEYWHVRLLDWY